MRDNLQSFDDRQATFRREVRVWAWCVVYGLLVGSALALVVICAALMTGWFL